MNIGLKIAPFYLLQKLMKVFLVKYHEILLSIFTCRYNYKDESRRSVFLGSGRAAAVITTKTTNFTRYNYSYFFNKIRSFQV